MVVRGVPRVQRAKNLARERHEGQRWSGLPYTEHLRRVAWTLARVGYTTPTLQCAAWLHDIREDSDTTDGELRRLFGDRVADLVDLVTDRPGENRAERHAATYPRVACDVEATVLKLADRCVNTTGTGTVADARFHAMYRREWPMFRDYLYRPGCTPAERRLWNEIEAALWAPSEHL